MAFRIEIAQPAIDDIDEAVAFIAQDSPSDAAKWKAGLEKLIFSLRDMPTRYPIIPEAIDLQRSYRSVIHHSHRVVFRIDDEIGVVYVVRVYHGARRPLTEGDVDPV